jgi:uroporphyrinogen III methyltransferase/synthase
VVYDRLAAPALLNFTSTDCERINVGKLPNKHTMPQEHINELLIEKGRAGKTVVRLKGGDPYVFGRGGEEALALAEAGIAFEVVPGVSSAVAVPAYAGIPVTHRGLASSFTVITSHEDPTKPTSSLNWQSLAQSTGTLVFLMGKGNLPFIAEQLIANGLAQDTPAAVISWGTCPQQRSLIATLATVAERASATGITNPCVVVVGSTVALANNLAWFESKPLFGRRIAVTRARAQSSRLANRLRELGAEALEFPLITLAAPANPEPLRRSLVELSSYDRLLFTSANGVEAFFEGLSLLGRDVRNLYGLKVAAIGAATAAALASRGLTDVFVPSSYVQEAFVAELSALLTPGERVLLPQAERARALLATELRQAGACVDTVVAYRTLPDEQGAELLTDALRENRLDILSFTSSSTVESLLAAVGDERELLAGVKLCSIGPLTSATLRAAGLHPVCEAATHTIDGLADALVHLCAQPVEKEA